MRRVVLIIARKCNLQDLKFGSKLKKAGFEVKFAFSEEEALMKAKECSVDLAVIVNNGNKKKNLRLLQQLQHVSDMPVTLLGKAGSSEIGNWLDAGADSYFAQPLNILEVEAQIKAILRRFEGEGKVVKG